MIRALVSKLGVLTEHFGLILTGRGIGLAFSFALALFAFLTCCGLLRSLGCLGSLGQSSTLRPSRVCRMMAVWTVWPVALSVIFHPVTDWRTTRVRIFLHLGSFTLSFVAFAFAFSFVFSLLRCESQGLCFLEHLFQLRFFLGFSFVLSFLRSAHLRFLSRSPSCIECSFACLDYFQFDKDFVALLPSFWLSHGRASCSVRSGSSVQTNLFGKRWSDLLYIGDELFGWDHSEPDVFHVLAGSLPSCLELDCAHRPMLKQRVPFASHSKLSFHTCFQKLVEPFLHGGVGLPVSSFFVHLILSFTHDVLEDHQARAGNALFQGYEHFSVCHTVAVIGEHAQAFELVVEVFDFSPSAGIVTQLRPRDPWLDFNR